MENGSKSVIIYCFFFLLLAIVLLSLSIISIKKLVDSKQFIRDQIAYFIQKVLALSLITYFFCFFSPENSSKFILSSLVIFIVFHFIEAVIIQNKINKRDLNG
tara:strand:+ start:9628 stop:9936 length:309 start_codon:yes stop_codon:yes gene_type:complete